MNSIEEYFDFLLNKYKLDILYNNFVTYLYLYVLTRESFFWIIILTQQSQLENKDLMLKIVCTVIGILILSVYLENIFLKYKTKLLVSLNKVHLEYMFDMFNNTRKSEILKLNMNEQFMYIENVKAGLDNIVNKRIIYSHITASSITVLLVSRRINVAVVGGLLVASNYCIYKMTKQTVADEHRLTDENIDLINSLRNYFTDSKQKIVNDLFNRQHCLELFQKYFDNNVKLATMENRVNTYNSIAVLVITLFVVFYKYKSSSIFDIIVYLLIVYDLDFLIDKIFELYKINKNSEKYNTYLQLLLRDKPQINRVSNLFDNIVAFDISQLKNTIPSLNLTTPLSFRLGDQILVEGKSGQGKTTFFKFLKNIETPDNLNIKVNNQNFNTTQSITENIYYTVQNNKILNDENLYEYISNYEIQPDIERIKKLLRVVNMSDIFDGSENKIIEVAKLSGGELMRLSLAQTLYEIISGPRPNIQVTDSITVENPKYDIILFDEIDVNLDNKTAQSIFNNIFDLFNDRILLFIVHNEDIKPLFTKRIKIENYDIKSNF